MHIDSIYPHYQMMLLLGAGASKSIEIPTTMDMAEEFLKSLESDSHREDIESHCKDIEEIIRYLSETGQEELEKKAYSFIREKCIKYKRDEAKGEKVKQIYEPIFSLSKALSLNMFTTNYDTVIEDTCTELHLQYDDGFVRSKDYPKFDHHAFLRSDIQIFKMHGSVTWYKDESSQTIFRFPLDLPETQDIKRMMIYPTKNKDIFTYPFYIFQYHFGQCLQRPETKELISVGHRFNDPHILAVVKATLATRSNFRLVIVNPRATNIKNEHFANESDQKVVVIEKSFEEWASSIRDEYVVKASRFDQEIRHNATEEINGIIDRYKTTEDFKKTVEEYCNAMKSEPGLAASPHAWDIVYARSPLPPSNLSNLDLYKMASALPNNAERIRNQMSMEDLSAPAMQNSVCPNCGHEFRRDTVLSPHCPKCGYIVM